MINSFWGDNIGNIKLKIEEIIGDVKIKVEELEENFETINKKVIKIRVNNIVNNINNVKCSNVKIGFKKNKK